MLSALFLAVNVEYAGAQRAGTKESAPSDGNCFRGNCQVS